MRTHPATFLILVLGLIWSPRGTFAAERPETALPAGVKAVWDLDKAFRQKSPTRERVCLNGLWRWQPGAIGLTAAPVGSWGFLKVPGAWPGPNEYDRKESQTAYPYPSWKKQDLTQVVRAWYQREFTVPDDWKGRRIALSLDYLNSVATVYVDGKRLGKLCFPAGELDMTTAVERGGKHVLSIFVEALPLKETVLAFNDTNMPQEIKGSVKFRGLCGDVFLVSTPSQTRITNVKIDPSVRHWTLTVHADIDGFTVGTPLMLRAKISDHGRLVKTLTSGSFGSDLVSGRFSFTQPWKPEKLWDLNTPQNQYDLELSLLDGGGKPVDVFLPVRFGFREFWIEGRDFMLNGTRVFWDNKPLDNPTLGAGMATYAAVKESIERMQGVGINMVYTHNYDCKPGTHLSFEETLAAADDAGMLAAFSMPHFQDYDWKTADAARTNGYAQHAAFYARVAQNHPSVVAYATSHNGTGYFEVMNPDLIDGTYASPPGENDKHALAAQAIIEKLDPSRIVYHHSSGNLGMMWTSNFYLNFVPVQERSDWFEHWATKGVKPAFMTEYGMPYFLNWTMYRGYYHGQLPWQGHNGNVPYELCIAEWDSQWLGDSAFKLSEEEKRDLRWEAKKFKAGERWQHWDYPVYFGDPVFDGMMQVVARYTADNWRAFRTWGVSGISPWTFDQYWKLREGVDRGRRDLKVDWDHLQRPGFSPDFIDARFDSMIYAYDRADWVPTAAGRAVLRNNRPLLAYLGGKSGAFSEKGHNFWAGESFEKRIIVVNNSRATVSCDCAWSVNLPTPQSGSAAFTAPTGDIHMEPLKISLPAGVKPGTYTLRLSAKFTPGGTQEDTFTINVLAVDPAALAGKMALFDPVGETTKMFQATGMNVDAVRADANLADYDVLIIGKGALTPEGPCPNLARVRDGLRVLVFEQHADVLEQRLGFRVQEYGLREVFRRVPDHSALDDTDFRDIAGRGVVPGPDDLRRGVGLDETLLKDWRGEATNMAPRLTYKQLPYPIINPAITSAGLTVTRPWRCGNRGNVASVLIEKPACGDFLPILDGGFSLQYSPLMVYREGKGAVMFCQMDVTARTEADPAASWLVESLLSYAFPWKPVDRRTILYAGEAAGRKHLEQAGFAVEPYTVGALKPDRVLVVAPGGGTALAVDKEKIAAWLKDDGHVLALGLDSTEANQFLPVKMETKSAEHIGTYFEPPAANSPLAGVGPADVHNRDPRDVPLVTGGARIVGDGVLATALDGRVVFCQISPWQFNIKQQNTKRTFRHTSFLLSRLLGNLGVQGQTPLLDRFASPVKLSDGQSPERRWLKGFYLDQPEEWDDPYRFFGW